MERQISESFKFSESDKKSMVDELQSIQRPCMIPVLRDGYDINGSHNMKINENKYPCVIMLTNITVIF